jgi:radical SAM-linked protein
MIGLPTENQEDLDALVRQCLEVWKLAKPSRSSVNVSISTFVPKPPTPFQWSGQLPQQSIKQHLDELRARLRRPGLRVKWHDPSHSFLEAVFARGDRRLGKVLLRSWQLGARFDGWSEVFREDLWQQAFSDTGVDAIFYANRERSLQEILPWDHLSSRVTKEFLVGEYLRALEGHATEDCRFARCSQCGVCDHETIRPHLYKELEQPLCLNVKALPDKDEAYHLYWFRYSKIGLGRFFGQLEVAQSFSRAMRRAGLPAVYTKGFHPHVKLSFVEALPLGLESRIEEGYLSLSLLLEGKKIQFLLSAQMPVGLQIEEVLPVERQLLRPPHRRVTYVVSALIPWRVRRVLLGWTKRVTETLCKKTKKGEVRAALGEILLDVRQLDESSMELDLYEGPEMNFRPMAILQHLLEEPLEALVGCRICKTAVAPFRGQEEEGYVLRAYHKR